MVDPAENIPAPAPSTTWSPVSPEQFLADQQAKATEESSHMKNMPNEPNMGSGTGSGAEAGAVPPIPGAQAPKPDNTLHKHTANALVDMYCFALSIICGQIDGDGNKEEYDFSEKDKEHLKKSMIPALEQSSWSSKMSPWLPVLFVAGILSMASINKARKKKKLKKLKAAAKNKSTTKKEDTPTPPPTKKEVPTPQIKPDFENVTNTTTDENPEKKE